MGIVPVGPIANCRAFSVNYLCRLSLIWEKDCRTFSEPCCLSLLPFCVLNFDANWRLEYRSPDFSLHTFCFPNVGHVMFREEICLIVFP